MDFSADMLTNVAEDIYQIRLPLPFALDHVNCYLLRGDDGWTIVDAGLNIPSIQAGWQAAFAELEIGPNDISQIILTHSHPDHYGLAGWLQVWCGATVWMSPREAELAYHVWEKDNLYQAMARMLIRSGVPEDAATQATTATQKMRALTLPHPHTVKLLEAGAVLRMGNRQFHMIHAPGHSDGQLVFYDAEDQLLLSGDQVLIKITPNIGLWPMTKPNPLGRYLASLKELALLEVRLALPGHGSLIANWQARLSELQQHHAERLEGMLAAVNKSGSTPYQISAKVFQNRDLTAHEVRFAISETLAHLDYLVEQQQLYYENADVWLYSHA